jgi:predicted signal transduction protein with EAL and GGDEF domain
LTVITDLTDRVPADAFAQAARRRAEGVEGVEDQLTADILRGFGFDLLQGFHFGRPVPTDRLAARSGTPV